MSGPKTGSSAIPVSDRKLVQNLKEIVPNSEDEIYAMLKECNMDLNETAQRLLNEDTFRVVRRKRDKKKENVNSKEHSESRSRPFNVGPTSRTGKSGGPSDRGTGRGSSQPRPHSTELSAGRGKALAARENGPDPSTRGSSQALNVTYGTQLYTQLKASASATSDSSSTPSASILLSNGGASQSWPTLGVQGSWAIGSGHATMADIVKSSSTHIIQPSGPASETSATIHGSVQNWTSSQDYIPSLSSVSGVHSSSSDPVLNPALDPRAPVPVGVMKRDVGTVGNQRPFGDQTSSFVPPDTGLVSLPQSQQSQPPGNIESDLKVLHSGIPTISSSTTYLEEQPESFGTANALVGAQGHSLDAPSLSGLSLSSQAIPVGSQFTSMSAYQEQQQHIDVQKDSVTCLDWKEINSTQNRPPLGAGGESTSVVAVSEVVSTSPPSPPSEAGILSSTATKLQDLNLQDDQPVIIPDHLRVSESDCTELSFGSFGAGFGTAFPSSFMSRDAESNSALIGESMPVSEVAISEKPTSLSVVSSSSSSLNHHQPPIPPPPPVENLVTSSDVSVSSDSTVASYPEFTKSEGDIQQSNHFSYLSTAPSYHGMNLARQMHTGQYSFEQTESRPQDISRLPSVLQPYSDPSTNYYSGVFRSGPDGEARYPSFLVAGINSKYSGNAHVTGQSLSLQESGNSVALSTSGSLGQSSQSVNGQAAMTSPQQSLPIHAYTHQPSGIPLGPFANVFGYQYVPPSFTYLHSPYQHGYTGISGYHQAPTGSAYPPGAAAVKYPVPQYKPTGVGVAGLQSSGTAGYGGGYNSSQPGTFAMNPTVTAGSSTSYDDVVTPQYKDNSLYMQGHQQAEGSTMWIQAQLLRDMPGLQANSYYNQPAQSQHTPYSHAQPSHSHAHPGVTYGTSYHPQQSGPSQSAHQLIQQPQVLGAGGAVGTQVGSYQQPQRSPQTWSNNF